MHQGERHPHIPARKLLESIVLGGSDGTIEGLAMTSALNGAGVGFDTIVLGGLAFAIAGAISMFFSLYLSRRSEIESLRIDRAREKMEIETEPEEERKEMVELLKGDGYGDAEVKVIMDRLSKDKDLWLREMLRRELKINAEESESTSHVQAVAAGTSFLLLALLAVSPYVLAVPRIEALAASVVISLSALFALGSRAFIPRNFRPRAGMESALIGAVAGAALYLVGLLLSHL
ncbi:MAG: VIT1/CCC1 transporter family protein [Nitrososphaerota archaeon]|nr:VIT1/CCC1 transporter family protein [Nitrososphaerota archaeon]